MKVFAMGLAGVLLMAGLAQAQGVTTGAVEVESGNVFGTILRMIVKWVFPVCAAYCFLHGVIGKGVKRGEWDMAAIGTIAAVGLALFPKLLSSLFGVTL